MGQKSLVSYIKDISQSLLAGAEQGYADTSNMSRAMQDRDDATNREAIRQQRIQEEEDKYQRRLKERRNFSGNIRNEGIDREQANYETRRDEKRGHDKTIGQQKSNLGRMQDQGGTLTPEQARTHFGDAVNGPVIYPTPTQKLENKSKVGFEDFKKRAEYTRENKESSNAMPQEFSDELDSLLDSKFTANNLHLTAELEEFNARLRPHGWEVILSPKGVPIKRRIGSKAVQPQKQQAPTDMIKNNQKIMNVPTQAPADEYEVGHEMNGFKYQGNDKWLPI